jgi:hypothetical protein
MNVRCKTLVNGYLFKLSHLDTDFHNFAARIL